MRAVKLAWLCLALTITSSIDFRMPPPSWAQKSAAKPATKSNNGKTLRRADFKIEGASCVVCLRRVATALRENKAVLKADVSIYRPHWSLVIYDSKLTSFDKLIFPIKLKEKIRIAALEDKPIKELPALVLPKGLGTPVND